MPRFDWLFSNNPNSLSEMVNTDTEQSRLKRAINQHAFEKNGLSQTHGKTFRERFFAIRQAIFRDFANVQGEDVSRLAREGKIISDNRKKIEVSDQFVPLTDSAEDAMTMIEAKIDEWYQRIKSENIDKDTMQEMVQRFLSVLYVAGVTIQPTTDGNKQTFKVLVSSYMHDLLPETAGIFPPMQQTDADHSQKKDMGITFVGGNLAPPDLDLTTIPVPPFEPNEEDEVSVLSALTLANKTNKMRISADASDVEFDQFEKKKAHLISKIAQALSYETKSKIFDKVQQEILMPSSAKGCLQRAALEFFIRKQKYDYWQIFATIFPGFEPKIARASWAVKTLWGSKDGVKFVEEYIFDGKLEKNKGNKSQELLFWKASNVFEAQRAHMWQVMETETDHEQRHTQMMEKYAYTGA
jgi:hypothetical protein